MFEALDGAVLEPCGSEPVNVVSAEVGRGLVLTQQVLEDDQHRMRQREGGPPLAPAARDAVLEGR